MQNNIDIPYGYCHCGCGGKTKLRTANGHIKLSSIGSPRKFIFGHVHIGRNRELNNAWKGGRTKTGKGYIYILIPDHPHATTAGYVTEHTLICEKVLGKYLPIRANAHHVDGKRGNNINPNLVICQNNAYHQLLHKRARAFKACGHADWRKCQFCKQYDNPINIVSRGNSSNFHQSCYNAYLREYGKSNGKEE